MCKSGAKQPATATSGRHWVFSSRGFGVCGITEEKSDSDGGSHEEAFLGPRGVDVIRNLNQAEWIGRTLLKDLFSVVKSVFI